MLQPMVVSPEKEREAFAQRLKTAAAYAGWDTGRGFNSRLKKEFGVSGEAARKWVEAISWPDTGKFPAMARTFGVRGEWLLTGLGDMVEKTEIQVDDIDRLINLSTPNTQESLQELSRMVADGKLSEDGLKTLVTIAQRIAERGKDGPD